MTVEAPPRSLADALRGWSDADLVELLRARPDLITPVPTDVAALAARAGSVPSVSRLLDRLDRFSLDVLEAMAALPEPLTRGPIVAALPGAPADEIEVVIARARALALVFGPDDDLRLVRTVVEALGPTPAGLGAAMAPAQERLAASLVAPGGLAALLADAPDGALEALDHLAWGPPHGRLDNARRPLVDPSTARSPVEWLLAHQLLVGVGPDTVVLPREVALHLRGGVVHRDTMTKAPALTVTERSVKEVDRSAPHRRSAWCGWSRRCSRRGASSRQACCGRVAWAYASCAALHSCSTSTTAPPAWSSRRPSQPDWSRPTASSTRPSRRRRPTTSG